ncbi:hypothetical protein [Microbacterium soli]|uniref:Uncharacterized protein n=1 Tax=Microbacterium soli TaxID=446075 RepID=A0ABP7NC66_9MICO
MAGIDIPTLLTSVGGSLIVSYIGVRYFTGAKIQAERSDAARRGLRAVVGPWLKSASSYVQRRKRTPARELGVAHTQDAVDALTVLRLAEDLPIWRRAFVRRRCRRVFGKEWVDIADRELLSAGEAPESSWQITGSALFANFDGDKPPVTFTDGLMHRAYATTDQQVAKKLVRELRKLREAY